MADIPNAQVPATPPAPALLAAICAAMGQVQRVTREGRNRHDGYSFASVDDFLALVNPICAATGLFVHMEEGPREDFERGGRNGPTAWMRQSYVLTLYHVSGECLPPVTRTVEVLRNGAQAYGAAQSYALKQFWRSLLLIPTGDKEDADYAATDPSPVTRSSRHWEEVKAEVERDRVELALEQMRSAGTIDELAAIWRDLPPGLRALPEVRGTKDRLKLLIAQSMPPAVAAQQSPEAQAILS